MKKYDDYDYFDDYEYYYDYVYDEDVPINKPEHTMKLKFIGESFYLFGLTNGKVYEAWEEDDDYYRVIDDSGEDYIYPKINPHAPDGSTTEGRWEIVEE